MVLPTIADGSKQSAFLSIWSMRRASRRRRKKSSCSNCLFFWVENFFPVLLLLHPLLLLVLSSLPDSCCSGWRADKGDALVGGMRRRDPGGRPPLFFLPPLSDLDRDVQTAAFSIFSAPFCSPSRSRRRRRRQDRGGALGKMHGVSLHTFSPVHFSLVVEMRTTLQSWSLRSRNVSTTR